MNLNNQVNSSKDLSTALIECREYAKRGNKLATDAVRTLEQTVGDMSQKLTEEINKLENSDFNDNKTSNNLKKQLSAISSDFEHLPQRLINDIHALSETSFSITLFGRTMAGKSTLMEILTHGKGNSIGKGAQRTTRDVRSYTYKGLLITDVPGIAAFEGKKDENLAFEAAKKGDLILFLITDDAPQASEAECLNKILSLGKPVICLINIKADITHSTHLKIFTYDIQKKFDKERLNKIKQQFLEFGKQYGQDWHTIQFAYVHLKSAFLSQQQDFQDNRDELYRLSRFSDVENLIVNEICKNGRFYKLKSFSDIVVVPLVDALETLFNQSAENNKQGSILAKKQQKLKEWANIFENNGKERIEAFLSSVSSELKCEIASFAEDNYDNPNASKEWNEILKSQNIEQRATDLLKQLCNECEEELREITREINAEIQFSHTIFSDHSINMPILINEKRIWNWTMTLLSGGLMIAGFFFSGPIGWIGAGISIIGYLGSFFFDDHEKKIREARQKLEKKLSDHIDKLIIKLRNNMNDVLYNELLKKHLDSMDKTLLNVIHSIFTLSRVQQKFAIVLNYKLQIINMSVIKEALIYLGYSGLEWHISNIARIPGYAIMIMLEDGTYFPDNASKDLSYLLKENVWFIFKKNNLESMLSQAIGRGCNKDTIRIQCIDKKPRIAHIPSLDTIDTSTKNRIRMAQQITELLIMK